LRAASRAEVVPGGFTTLLVQPDGAAGGFAAMLDHGQAILPAKAIGDVPQTLSFSLGIVVLLPVLKRN